MSVEDYTERRQRAREAGYDAYDDDRDGGAVFAAAIEAAIETATRVRITHEAIMAFIQAPDREDGDIAGPLAAFLVALGFEVEE